MQNCKFISNSARTSTALLYLNGVSQFTLDHCTFDSSNQFQDPSSQIQGGFMQIISDSIVYITNSYFLGGYALNGGAIYIFGSVGLYISNSLFVENKAIRQGGAIYAYSFNTLNITEDSEFYMNSAIKMTGDAIFASNSLQYIDIKNALFHSTVASNFINFDVIQQVNIDNSVFKISDLQQNSLGKVSGVLMSDISELKIDHCMFTNLIGESAIGGGALQIVESQANKAATNSRVIINTIFENCTNTNGGAIGINDVANVHITNNTQFIGNNATQAGGAINYFCNNHGLDFSQCSLFIDSSIFQLNYASVEGGAIKWNVYQPNLTNNYFSKNEAGIYGQQFASVPKNLIRISSAQLDQVTIPLDLRQLQTVQNEPILNSGNNSDLNYFQSGSSINLYFALIDKYRQIVRNEDTSSLYLSPIKNMNSNFSSLIESSTSIVSKNGIFVVENFQFVGQPKSTQIINVTTDGIDYTIPDNQISFNSTQSPFFSLSINLRGCITGESLSILGQCTRCNAGQYILYAPNEPEGCLDCPSQLTSECLGGNLLYPLPGYWRSSITSDNILQCRNDVACMQYPSILLFAYRGRNPPENNPFGACSEGYQGVICADCTFGYSRTGSNYQCSACPSKRNNILKVIGLLLLVIVGLIFLVKSTLENALTRQNYLSVMVRILMNHLQLLALTASFNLEWPQKLAQFFSIVKPAADVSTQFLSVDCILDLRQQSNFSIDNTTAILNGVIINTASQDGIFSADGGVYRVYFQKLIILALLPFVVFVVSISIWNAIFAYNDNKARQIRIFASSDQQSTELDTSTGTLQQSPSNKGKLGKIVSTIVVILFLIQPTITKSMLSAFKQELQSQSIYSCQNIDGTERLYEDLQIECQSYVHLRIAYIVALPALIIWGLGIPCEGLFLVCKNRKKLAKISIKSRYGFLYNGYKRRAFFWEFVIMYRKINSITFALMILYSFHVLIQFSSSCSILIIEGSLAMAFLDRSFTI